MDVTNQEFPEPKNNLDRVGQIAEGKTFDFFPESHIKTSELKTFDFADDEQIIEIYTEEFNAVCPFSGLPDIAKVKIRYRAAALKAVELKSLKYYFTSFRNVGIYQEAVTTRIYEDLRKILHLTGVGNYPHLYVETIYNIRGGFLTTCTKGQWL